MKSFVLDTETTDLIRNSALPIDKQPRIIELYGCVVEGGRVVDEIEFFAALPRGMALSEDTTKITGITNKHLVGAKPFSAHADFLAEMVEGCDEVVAHNLSFDMSVVNIEFKRLERSIRWPVIQTCTVEGTEHLEGYRLKLADLHELLFGERFEGAHRARADVEALVRCFVELRKRGEL